MATLYVAEFETMAWVGPSMIHRHPAAAQPALAAYAITITSPAAQGPTFNAKTRFIELHSDATCSFAIGSAAVATANRMAANEPPRYYGVNGSGYVSVISNT